MPAQYTYQGVVSYFGGDFSGWQRQKNSDQTVQRYLEDALAQITGIKTIVIAAGRTDAGVHARRQIISFKLKDQITAGKLIMAINGNIPKGIAVTEIKKMPDDFNALAAATRKWYRYRILNRRARCPLRYGFVYFVPYALNLQQMRVGATTLIGTHDFTSFCASRSQASTKVRTLEELAITAAGDELHLDFKAPGFLYKMVRNITGTLVEVGRGQLKGIDVAKILNEKKRSQAGPTAPAYGLTLMDVEYE